MALPVLLQFQNGLHCLIRGAVAKLMVLGTLRLAKVKRLAATQLPPIPGPTIHCGSPSFTPIPGWLVPFDSWCPSESNSARYIEIGPG